jgi:putative transcriptional regulator
MRALRERAGLLDVARELECAESSIRNYCQKMEVWQVFRMRDLYRCSEAELVLAVRKSIGKERTDKTDGVTILISVELFVKVIDF